MNNMELDNVIDSQDYPNFNFNLKNQEQNDQEKIEIYLENTIKNLKITYFMKISGFVEVEGEMKAVNAVRRYNDFLYLN